MKKKALYSYAGLVLIVFLMRIYPARFLEYLLPAYLVAVPVFLAGEIHFSFSAKHLMSGLIV